MAKTEFLQIRLSPTDRERVIRAAAAEHLDASTWARRVLLTALEEATQRENRHRVTSLEPSTIDNHTEGTPAPRLK